MPKQIPSWVFDPENKVLGIIYGAVIGGISTMLALVVGEFRTVSNQIQSALLDAGVAIQTAGRIVGMDLLAVPYAFRSVFVSAGLSGGVAAPISVSIVTVLFGGVMVVVIGALAKIAKLVIPP